MSEAKKLLIPITNIPGMPTSFRVNKKREVALCPDSTLAGTMCNPYRVGYILFRNGFGDFLIFARAFEYLADRVPHIYGIIFCPGFLVEYYKFLFRDRRNWSVEATEITGCYRDDWFNPHIQLLIDPWRNGKTQFITAQGMHPLELGFAYYACVGPSQIPPEYNCYPELDFTDEGLPKEIAGKNYICFAVGSIRNTGRVPGEKWNPILAHVKSLGLIPVIIGKSAVTEGYNANFPTGINLDGVISLWDRTTVLQAAQVIQYAKAIVGLDSGLLHLAGCTKTPIVFGYNVTSVELRKPRRREGKIVDVFLTKDELRCIGCLTDVKAFYNHDFNLGCLYEKWPEHNMACVTRLFENGGERWINAVNLVLEEK